MRMWNILIGQFHLVRNLFYSCDPIGWNGDGHDGDNPGFITIDKNLFQTSSSSTHHWEMAWFVPWRPLDWHYGLCGKKSHNSPCPKVATFVYYMDSLIASNALQYNPWVVTLPLRIVTILNHSNISNELMICYFTRRCSMLGTKDIERILLIQFVSRSEKSLHFQMSFVDPIRLNHLGPLGIEVHSYILRKKFMKIS